eukprot:5741169-Pleurochrysis_carterae.AAC.3
MAPTLARTAHARKAASGGERARSNRVCRIAMAVDAVSSRAGAATAALIDMRVSARRTADGSRALTQALSGTEHATPAPYVCGLSRKACSLGRERSLGDMCKLLGVDNAR